MPDLSEELFKFNPWWERDFAPQIIPRPYYEDYLVQHTNTKSIILITV